MNTWIKIECTDGCLRVLSEQAYFAYAVVCRVWEEDVFITSTVGDKHLMYSRHYRSDAIDVRPPQANRDKKVQELMRQLGGQYDVVDEGDHIHIEYDPD